MNIRGLLLIGCIAACSASEAAPFGVGGTSGNGGHVTVGGAGHGGAAGTDGGSSDAGRAGAGLGNQAGAAGSGAAGSGASGSGASGSGASASGASPGGAASVNGGAPVGGRANGSGGSGASSRGGGASGAASGGQAPLAGAGGSMHAGAAGTPAAGAGSSPAEQDVFGVRKLYPSASSDAEWNSEHWAAPAPYAIRERRDPQDPFGLSGMRGTGSLEVNGGELVMSGSQPRIYVYPGPTGPWRDVEVTVYYKRVEDDATAYAGLVVGVRSGADGHNEDTACDAHTYYARLRHDGAIDFEKELKHPASSTRQRIAPQMVWPPDGQLPFDTWIGWKFVIYNLSSARVKLESYRDLTQGADGGDWQLMNETIDDGGWSVESDCPAHQPVSGQSDHIILDGGTTFVRNTGVAEARYKWMSVRAIEASRAE